MRPDHALFVVLDRQAAAIDSLRLYLCACERRGLVDIVAEQSLEQAIRLYRRSLASTDVDTLFAYATRKSESLQS